MMSEKNKVWKIAIMVFLLVFGIFAFAISSYIVKAEVTVCCEKTKNGAFCQNVPADECAPDSDAVPTSCDSTSYCKPGVCYDSSEGTCLDNTPQIVCNNNGGVWSAEPPAQCQLGCCILGDQAAFVSLVRCKKLSSSLGILTNYDKSVVNEVACVAKVQQQDRGACVYESEFQRTCKFTTRAECGGLGGNSTIGGTEFYKDKLCSAEELGTTCGPSRKTSCLPGKDEVYFVDTCGNPANIYDASKLNDKEYWTNVKTKQQSCLPGSANAGSAGCGNCNYLLGSYCRSSNVEGKKASYGDNICANLNCVDESGKPRVHGESWCASDKKIGNMNAVGSRFFRRLCLNGEVTTEPCKDFRAEECVEDSIQTPAGEFSQAACRVNRWQDCLTQADKQDCENQDRRDCSWREGVTLGNSTIGGTCLPENSPGLDFWSNSESKVVCGAGNKICVVKYQKGLFGGEQCVDNCECLEPGWEAKYGSLCSALGDCGAKVNYEGKKGFRDALRILVDGKNKSAVS